MVNSSYYIGQDVMVYDDEIGSVDPYVVRQIVELKDRKGYNVCLEAMGFDEFGMRDEIWFKEELHEDL